MAEGVKILVVDDELPIRKLLRAALSQANYEVIEAASGKEALGSAATYNPVLMLLDLGLPDLDGVEVITQLREWSTIPVIVLSAKGEEQTKVQALDQGANDYVTKPFSVTELLARIRVALRSQDKNGAAQDLVMKVGNLEIDFQKYQVLKDGAAVHLTPLEFKLLGTLAKNAGRIITHRQLLTEVWGKAYARENHYLRIYMKNLRHKLEADPTRPKLLLTESGVGYRLGEG